jgi:hypothetical protein
MRISLVIALTCLAASPAFAEEPSAANLYGRDPGNTPAYACFSKTFGPDWLKAHPDQNVTRLKVFAERRVDEGYTWDTPELELTFRDSKANYRVSATCSAENGVFSCGVDCEGGGFKMTAASTATLSVTFDGYLRYSDEAESAVDAPSSGFQSGDKNLMLDRTDLRDCLPLVIDDAVKARIASGTLTQ